MDSTLTHRWRTPTTIDPSLAVPAWGAAAWDLLLAHGSGLAPRPAIIDTIRRHAGVLTCLKDRRIDSLLYHWQHQESVAQSLYDLIWAQQFAALREVVSALDARGIVALMLKGTEALATYARHGAGALSLMDDVDLLVREAQLGATQDALLALGFSQGEVDRSGASITPVDASKAAFYRDQHHELYPLRRLQRVTLDEAEAVLAATLYPDLLFATGGAWFVTVEFAVHHRLAYGLDPEPFFAHAQASAHGFGQTLDPAHHLWLIATRYYAEIGLYGKRTLRELAQLAIFAKRAVDWDRLLALADEHHTGSSLYYPLATIAHFTGGVIPARILAALRAARGASDHDWGWQLGPLFGFVEQFPTVRRGPSPVLVQA